MEMTKEEIISSYMQADNKPKQIGILADLNACSRQTIYNVLHAGGVEVEKPKKGVKKVFGKEVEVNKDELAAAGTEQQSEEKEFSADADRISGKEKRINIPESVRTVVECEIKRIDRMLEDLLKNREELATFLEQ